jgi:hypothetical protein
MYLLIWVILVILLLIITKSRTPITYRVKKGKEISKNSNVILATCVRDAGEKIKNIEFAYNYFSKFFKKVKLIVMENDSKDKTREKLLNLKNKGLDLDVVGCGLNANVCEMNLNNVRYGMSSARTRRMAKIRNILVDHIKTIQGNYDFCIMFDGDLKLDISTDGMLESIYHIKTRKDVDAICAYTMTYLSKLLGRFYDTFSYEPLKINPIIPVIVTTVFSFFLNGIVKVRSCFNGLTIYKLPFADHMKYYESTSLCEHISFHRKMNIYMNTNFICNIKSFTTN